MKQDARHLLWELLKEYSPTDLAPKLGVPVSYIHSWLDFQPIHQDYQQALANYHAWHFNGEKLAKSWREDFTGENNKVAAPKPTGPRLLPAYGSLAGAVEVAFIEERDTFNSLWGIGELPEHHESVFIPSAVVRAFKNAGGKDGDRFMATCGPAKKGTFTFEVISADIKKEEI